MSENKTPGKVSNLYEDKLRVASSIPGLNNKIQTKLDGFTDKIYWYIKFNLKLERKSVSDKTMYVTDTRGYILKTDISYDEKRNCIAIFPEDSYESDQFYLLTISKKVCSESGQKLKNEIHILFKLVDNKISEYKVLQNNTKVPKPKARPTDYEQNYMNPKKIVRNSTSSRIYTFDKSDIEDASSPDKLLSLPIKTNMLLGIIGLILTIIAIYLKMVPFLAASMVVAALGIAHIVFQISNKKWRAVFYYNRGVRLFNAQSYNGAEVYFKKALLLDPYNEVVEYAINKLTYYL